MQPISSKFGLEPPLVDLQELTSWILYEDEHLLVFNKPGWLVCHPSKNGPLSSLVGAAKVYTNLERLHLVARLDRETSGVVIFAKNRKYAGLLQSAIEHRQVHKEYLAILEGQLTEEIIIEAPLAKDRQSLVHVKQTVRQDRTAQSAKTKFTPLKSNNKYTLAQVHLYTGRKHQIRAHALHLAHPIVADKIYGPDETLYLEFIESGWTENLEANLPLKRQALHASKISFASDQFSQTFQAPLTEDLQVFCNTEGLLSD